MPPTGQVFHPDIQFYGRNPTKAEISFLNTDTRLPSGEPALLVDPGSRGNLAGDIWARQQTRAALKAGKKDTDISQRRRKQPLEVMGVGHGTQKCEYDMSLPIEMDRIGGGTSHQATFTTPIVGNGDGVSDLPGLLGFASMSGRTLLDPSSA